MIRTLGIIGDVHTEHERLERAIAHLQSLSPDKILCVGDLVDGPGDIVRCCELLQQHNVETVAGNHERWFFSQSQSFRQALPEHTPKWSIEADSYAFLRALPKVRSYQSIAGQIMLCHGLDEDDMASVGPDDYGYALECNDIFQRLLAEQEHPIIINGHTHKMMLRTFNGGGTELTAEQNGGSRECSGEPTRGSVLVGEPFTQHAASKRILRFSDAQPPKPPHPPNNLTILNAGTLYREHQPGFLFVDLAQREVHFYRFDPALHISLEKKVSMD